MGKNFLICGCSFSLLAVGSAEVCVSALELLDARFYSAESHIRSGVLYRKILAIQLVLTWLWLRNVVVLFEPHSLVCPQSSKLFLLRKMLCSLMMTRALLLFMSLRLVIFCDIGQSTIKMCPNRDHYNLTLMYSTNLHGTHCRIYWQFLFSFVFIFLFLFYLNEHPSRILDIDLGMEWWNQSPFLSLSLGRVRMSGF